MYRLAAGVIALGTLLAASGCGEHGVARVASGDGRVLRAAGEDGQTQFMRRIDGSVVQILRADVFGGSEDLVVLTGPSPGENQCEVMVLTAGGEDRATPLRLSSWDLGETSSGESPERGEVPSPTMQWPMPDMTTTFSWRGRRFLAVGTMGVWWPFSVEIFEAKGNSLRSVRTLWNRGTLVSYTVSEEQGVIAVLALNNLLGLDRTPNEEYRVGLAVHRLDDILRDSATSRRFFVPSSETDGHGYARYFAFPFVQSRGHESRLAGPVIERRTVREPLEDGLTYVFGIDDGSVQVEADEEYRKKYEAQREEDPTLPPLDGTLKDIAAKVELWPR